MTIVNSGFYRMVFEAIPTAQDPMGLSRTIASNAVTINFSVFPGQVHSISCIREPVDKYCYSGEPFSLAITIKDKVRKKEKGNAILELVNMVCG
jgi:hypothetical protein